MQRAGVLAQHFHGNRALASNHVRVVEGVDEGQAAFFFKLRGVGVGIRITVAVQHHITAECLDSINFELRRGGGHHNHGARAELLRRHGHTLRVVAC